MRNTKIVVTFGPACAAQSMINEVVQSGADIFRLNFAHVDYDGLGAGIESIRRAGAEAGRHIPILQELQGLRIRTSNSTQQRELHEGDRIRLTPGEESAAPDEVGITYARIADMVQADETIVINEGLIVLSIEKVVPPEIHCSVRFGGTLRPRQTVSIRASTVPFELTDKDFLDLRFGVEHGVDMVAVPGIRTADDVNELREMLHGLDMSMPLLARLENKPSISNIGEIAEAADGIVFARGDLAVALGAVGTLTAQRRVAQAVVPLGKPMIMAYPMFESMIDNHSPTFFETAALYQAIGDGYSAIILAGETSVGRNPVMAVREAARVAEETERLLGAAVGFHSCFISYSSDNEDFARRLRTDLIDRGVQCWFAPEDLKIGDKIRERISRSIWRYDRLLLILSAASVSSKWVETEVETALAKEQDLGPVLFPVRLDDAVMHTDTAWAAEIRQTRHIGDFRRWKEHDSYQESLARLLRDLREGTEQERTSKTS